MSQINTLWKVYNTVTGLYEWGSLTYPPTVAFSNPSQSIDTTKTIAWLDTAVKPTIPMEDFKGTSGSYMVQCFSLTIAPNTTGTLNYSWPFQTVALNIKFTSDSTMLTDSINFLVPVQVIGELSADIAIGTTVIPVSSGIPFIVNIGQNIYLTDGVNRDFLGRVLSKDTTSSTITVETATTHAFATASPTYVQLEVYFIQNYVLGLPRMHIIGDTVLGGSAIPAHTSLQCNYTNTSSTDSKVFNVYLEFLY
jgi:hypothetical protein